MERLNPEKLNVEYRQGVTKTEPVLGRKYTLTHSDITAELYLTMGTIFAYDKITNMRDEVLAEWRMTDEGFYLYGTVYTGNFGPIATPVRNAIFRRELPLALEAIIYGEREFFFAYPQLVNAPIWIYFDSTVPKYNQFEYWGTINDYT